MRTLLVLFLMAGCHQWQPLRTIPGASLRTLAGNPSQAGPFRYQIRVPAGARIESHRHDVPMNVRVLRGSMYIEMNGGTHHYLAGREFTIPAGTWHTEWWDAPSTMEVSGIGPMRSEMAP